MKNSRVWSHFNTITDVKSECVHCRKIISKNGGTSNLKKHLTRKHPETAADLELYSNKNSYDDPIGFEDDEKIKNFIYMIQMNPIVYKKTSDVELSAYEKRAWDTVWEEISNEFMISESDCRSAWLTLRKQYEMYLKTKNPDKCKFINQLGFLDEILISSKIEKIPMKDTDRLTNNYESIDASKKVLISVPDISDTPLHEISVSKTEYIDENSAEDYEILFEDFDPILVKNQAVDESLDKYHNQNNTESISPEENEWENSTRHASSQERYRQKTQKQTSNQNRNGNIRSEGRYYSNNSIHNQNSSSSPKRVKRSTDGMDEIDFFFEFLQRKIRKLSPDTVRQLQMKFMETIQEAEIQTRKRVDQSVDTSDAFE